MGSVWRNLRYAARQLMEDKAFSIAAILTLALGIGATITIFTVVNAVLLNRVPYRAPERLVILQGKLSDKSVAQAVSLSQTDVADWREQSTVFSSMSVWGSLAFNLEQGDKSQRLSAELVNQSYLSLLGLQPALGRFFTPEEDAKPLERYVVVLGYDLWRHSFGADPAILGRTLRFNGMSYQVVGVGPQGFHGLSDRADLWVPSMLPPVRSFITSRGLRWALGVARLKPGVSLRQAQEQMNGITAALDQANPDTNRGLSATMTPIKEFFLGSARGGLLILTVGAALLLLIACINVANLLLTRAAARQRAWSIRIMLGASRPRLIGQMLTESILLSLIGAAAGFLLALWATRSLIAVSGISFPSFVHIGVTPEVILVTAGLALVCGVAFGLAPIWASFRTRLSESLGRNEKLPPGRNWHRFQNILVIAQVALALTLSVDSLLMAKSFRKMISEDLGFRPQNLLTYRMDMRGPKYDDEKFVTKLLGQEYLPRITGVPGVGQVAMSDPTVPTDDIVERLITIEDHDSDSATGTYPAMVHAVSPRYFEILGIPITNGRPFDEHDTDSFAVIVSQSMARQQWPGQNPIGKRLKLGARVGGQPVRPWLTVVGVAAEVRYQGYDEAPPPAPDMYVSLLQFIFRPPLTVNFLVRAQPGVSTAQLRRALHLQMTAIDPEVPDYDVATMEERLAVQTQQQRFQLILINIFAVLALILAAIGIYGVISYGVAQRRAEIAVRMSLGADRGAIFRMVVIRGALLTAVGLVLGLVGVFSLSPLLISLLYKTSILDPLILIGACLGLFAITLMANYMPARRAAALDPMVGLR
ncbi:MAG TPA: ABC transporter permease [Thermoanaerobaculia bacterium]|jgi:putative ABC transport system permease protein|nr:ABC transporter permease [Thermoanaerobaculia bacterium]